MISFLVSAGTSIATAQAVELFISGVGAAISLYCGTKTPKNKRK